MGIREVARSLGGLLQRQPDVRFVSPSEFKIDWEKVEARGEAFTKTLHAFGGSGMGACPARAAEVVLQLKMLGVPIEQISVRATEVKENKSGGNLFTGISFVMVGDKVIAREDDQDVIKKGFRKSTLLPKENILFNLK